MIDRSLLTVALICMSVGAQAQMTDAGKREYMVACAGCHGESAMGNGPFADLLNISTPGLSRLSKENDGRFPYDSVFATIDGRDGVRAHGSAMPIWGDRFQASATSQRGETADMVAFGRILALVSYLQSIQE